MIKKIVLLTFGFAVALNSHTQTSEEITSSILQREKNAFFASDSAEVFVNDLGWMRTLADSAQGKKAFEYPIPVVLRLIENGKMSIHLPCWEEETDEYYSACVLTQHHRLDSALIHTKIKGVDDIYQRESGSYADYMHKAQLSCVSIKQIGDVFHVNASVRVPKTALVVDKKALKKNLKKLEKESKGKLKEEKAEAPNRL